MQQYLSLAEIEVKTMKEKTVVKVGRKELLSSLNHEEGPKTVGITDASSRRLFGCREVVQVMAGSETKSGLSLPLMVVRHAGKIGVGLLRR